MKWKVLRVAQGPAMVWIVGTVHAVHCYSDEGGALKEAYIDLKIWDERDREAAVLLRLIDDCNNTCECTIIP